MSLGSSSENLFSLIVLPVILDPDLQLNKDSYKTIHFTSPLYF